mgnify:CR=1 FL=1
MGSDMLAKQPIRGDMRRLMGQDDFDLLWSITEQPGVELDPATAHEGPPSRRRQPRVPGDHDLSIEDAPSLE